jgi:hypothetical protein
MWAQGTGQMARYNDLSSDCTRWTNRKLMHEARRLANFETFGASMIARGTILIATSDDATDFVREETRIYRATWLAPILDEIERRFVK